MAGSTLEPPPPHVSASPSARKAGRLAATRAFRSARDGLSDPTTAFIVKAVQYSRRFACVL